MFVFSASFKIKKKEFKTIQFKKHGVFKIFYILTVFVDTVDNFSRISVKFSRLIILDFLS